MVLDDILTKPGWDIDFSKGVEISDLKRYMERLEFQDKINKTNYRVIALYATIGLLILAYFVYLAHWYLSTMECTFRRSRRRPARVPTNLLESLEGINQNNAEGNHYELEYGRKLSIRNNCQDNNIF